jgi:hypothetical protein
MRRFACLEAVPKLLDASPAASRLATLKGLDPPELAALQLQPPRRLTEAVKVLERSAPLQPQSDIFTIEPALPERRSLHQRASKTYFFLDLIHIMLLYLARAIHLINRTQHACIQHR